MLRIVLLLVTVVLGLTFFVRWLEPRFAFFPTRGESSTPSEYGVPFTSATLTTSDGEVLHAWHLRAANPRALVVYFHGNGGNLSVWAPILADLARHGYDVFAVDYRGYGASSGRPTEAGLYRDADAVVQQVSGLAGGRPVIYWGRSLGTAIAAYAASRHRPDGIILESGFSDAMAIVRASPLLRFLSMFSTYRFETAKWLEHVDAPALVLHGDADSVIPYVLGRDLFDRMKGDKAFVTIPGGDHNDATPADDRLYWDAIDNFSRAVESRRPAP
jgi:uncharacterized protein